MTAADGDYDLFIVGGGINGVGVARDAAGRGLKVALAERDDLGAHTSSASTKLIHGGLRYLEHYEFRLVRESLRERETLLRAAPHIIWPLRFVLPHHKGLRPAWLLRLGLFLYDHIGGAISLPKTERVDLTAAPYDRVLKGEFQRGFAYSDCWVEDSRLVVLNAVDAEKRGARIMTRTECIGLSRAAGRWMAQLKSADGVRKEISARIVVNAAGPWVDEVAGLIGAGENSARTRLVKGSHIVVRRIYAGDHAFIFQNTDGRIVFAIPYERDFTLIGTTDVNVEGPREGAAPSNDEEEYLCALANAYFRSRITREDIVWRYSGVRPLFDDHAGEVSKVTRDYRFILDADGPPALSIYGGKITTYRKLAEHALEKLRPHIRNLAAGWTADAPLPGGDFDPSEFDGLARELSSQHKFLPLVSARRLLRAYGTNAGLILNGMGSIESLGLHFGADLYENEVRYLTEREFAQTADDILWRRSKLGLRLSQGEKSRLESYLGTE